MFVKGRDYYKNIPDSPVKQLKFSFHSYFAMFINNTHCFNNMLLRNISLHSAFRPPDTR